MAKSEKQVSLISMSEPCDRFQTFMWGLFSIADLICSIISNSEIFITVGTVFTMKEVILAGAHRVASIPRSSSP